MSTKSGFTTKSLADVTSLITDGAHFSPKPRKEGRLIANVKDMREHGIDFDGCTRIDESDFQYLSRQNCSPIKGDVLLSKDGTMGRVVLFEGEQEIVLLSSIAILRPNELIEPAFLKHLLRSDRTDSEIRKYKSGSALPRITVRAINRFTYRFPLDPEEQRRIAEILDTADEAIQKTEALIAKLKQMKAGLLHDLLTRGIDENGELREAVASEEHGWRMTPLAALSTKLITYGIVQPGRHVPDGVPFVQTKDLKHGYLSPETMDRTSNSIAASYERSAIKSGDIVIGIRATVGDCLIIPDSLDGANISRGVARISPSKDVNTNFLLWALRSRQTQDRLKHAIKGSTYAEITLPALRETCVPVPPKPEQVEIANRIDAVETRISAERITLKKLTVVKAGLMHDLLTGNKRVNVAEPVTA